MAVAHVALDLGLGNQRGHGVDDHHVDGAGAHQRLADVQRLLAVVRLGHVELVDVHAQLLGVHRIQRVLGVDERGGAAHLLGLRNAVQRHGGLTGGFRPVDLNDAALGQSAHAQREVQLQAARGDDLHLHLARRIAQLHHRALAEVLLNLAQRDLQRLLAIVAEFLRRGLLLRLLLRCHLSLPPWVISGTYYNTEKPR